MTTPTLQFLKDVCAAGVQYYLSLEASHNYQHKSLQTLESAGLAHQSNNVYFCPASFHAGGERNDSGVHARRSFVLDVDVRPGVADHFHTTADARAAVEHLVAQNYLPAYSYMVDSGSGLHVYWVAPTDLGHQDWLTVNNGFIHRMDTCGEPRLISDRKTSRRYSGLFRLPGTNNTKHGSPLPCQILAGSGVRIPQEWVDFWGAESSKLSAAVVNKGGAPVALSPALSAQVQPWMLGAPLRERMVCKEDPVVVNPEAMLTTCKVLWSVVQNPTQYKEPQYLEVARALSTARGGRQIFHKVCAADHARYTPDWADEKFDHARSGFDKPVNCRNLRDAITGGGTSLCQGCPMFDANRKPRALQSAFELRADDMQQEQTPVSHHVSVGDEYPFTIEQPTHAIPTYLDHTNPHNEFLVNPMTGNSLSILGALDSTTNQRSAPEIISSKPFWFSKVWGVEDKRNWADRKLTVTYLQTGGTYETFEVDPPCAVDPRDFIKAAAWGGLGINGSAKNVERIRRYLLSSKENLEAQPDHRALTYEKLGWKKFGGDRAFLLGNDMFRGSRRISVSRADNFAEVITDNWGIGREGSYQKHLDAVMTYNHPDIDPSVKLTLLLGLGSPLLAMLPSARTTFIMLRGEGGVGKSDTMKVVLSIYGRPEHTLLSSSDTDRGMKGGIGGANNLPLYFDEITTTEEDEFRDMLLETNTSGRRLLANRDSSAKKSNDSSSCTFVMVSSNKSLVEFVPGLQDGDIAAKDRCLEIPFEKMNYAPHWEATFADMQETLQENCGWLGAVFVDYVLDNYDAIKKQLRDYYQTEYKKAGSDGKRRFDCRAIAVARMTEQIMQDLGWMAGTSWTDDALTQKKLRMAIDDEAERNKAPSSNAAIPLAASQQMDSFIGDMVASNKDAFITVTDGVVPDMFRTMRKVAGVTVVDTKSHGKPVEQVVVFAWFFNEYARRSNADVTKLVNAWRLQGNDIVYDGKYPARRVTKINGLSETMAVWKMPPRYTTVPE